MPIPVVRFLVAIELEGDLEDAESLFRSFQEDVESAFARTVERVTPADLKVFAPDIVTLGTERINVEVPPIVVPMPPEWPCDDDVDLVDDPDPEPEPRPSGS